MTREQIDALSDDPDEMRQQLQDMAGRRGHPRRQLRRRPPAAQVADQGDPHHPRRVRRGEPLRRRALHRHHHAAGHRPAARRRATPVPRRRAERPQSRSRRVEGARSARRTTAAASAARSIKQKARSPCRVNSNDVVRHAELERCAPDRRLRRRRWRCGRPRDNMYVFGAVRLRDHQGPDAAGRRSTRSDNAARTSASAPSTCRSAPTAPRTTTTHVPHPGSGSARPPLLHQHARVDQLVATRISTRRSRRRPSGCWTRSRAAAQQRRAGVTSKTIDLQSDLDYVRGIHSCAPACSSTAARTTRTTRPNYLGTYTFESLVAFASRHAAAATRMRIGDPNIAYNELPGRRVPAGRHPRPQEPDAQPRRALRSADTPRITTTSDRGSA